MQTKPAPRAADTWIGLAVIALLIGFYGCAAVFGWDVDAVIRWLIGLPLVALMLFLPVALLLWLVAWIIGRR